MDNDIEVFKGKMFSSLCEDIYNNSTQKRDQIDILVSELRMLIKGPNDAMIMVPLIKEYLDVSVKNDEHLVKLAAVLQRLINSSTEEGETGFLSEQEKEQLLKEIKTNVEDMNATNKEISKSIDETNSKKEKVLKNKPK